MNEILKKLYELSEPDYAAFTARLIPDISPDKVLGVRSPALRSPLTSGPLKNII